MAFFHNMATPQGGYSQEEIQSARDFNSFSLKGAGEDDSTTPSRSPSPLPSPSRQRTVLDKPLEELTEEDITHLTREDCRRYLKQKGMRRPSWNKAQAIQQVLSLKGLFDSKDGEAKSFGPLTGPKKCFAEPAFLQKTPEKSRAAIQMSQIETIVVTSKVDTKSGEFSRDQNTKDKNEFTNESGNSSWGHPNAKVSITMGNPLWRSTAYACTDQINAASLELEEGGLFQQKSCSEFVQASGSCGMEQSSQLTIFYSGMVNVYDDVPENKARDVMLLAEKSNKLRPSLCMHVPSSTFGPLDSMQGGNVSSRSMPDYVAGTIATTDFLSTQATPSPLSVAHRFSFTQSDYQPSRKACVQRYLEKRRGRNARSTWAASMNRVDGDGFSGQLMSETPKFGSFLEMVGSSFTHFHNPSHVQPSHTGSGIETSSSPHLRSYHRS